MCWCKSTALTQGGWHLKYVNAKAIKCLLNLSPRLLTDFIPADCYFFLLNCCELMFLRKLRRKSETSSSSELERWRDREEKWIRIYEREKEGDRLERGVRELKWPCGLDADKLPSLSVLSAPALMCPLCPVAFHPFLHVFSSFRSLHLISPVILSLPYLCIIWSSPSPSSQRFPSGFCLFCCYLHQFDIIICPFAWFRSASDLLQKFVPLGSCSFNTLPHSRLTRKWFLASVGIILTDWDGTRCRDGGFKWNFRQFSK